jgi:hypothetical protein
MNSGAQAPYLPWPLLGLMMTTIRRSAEAGTVLARTARTMRCASAADRARISPVFSSRLAGFPLACDPRTRGLYQILNAGLASPPSSPSSRAPTMSPHGICGHHDTCQEHCDLTVQLVVLL